jgi:hypothetical protein
MLGLLEEQRNNTRLKLAELLLGQITNGTGLCVHRCGWTSKYAYAYMMLLEQQNLWPMRLHCLSQAIESAETMPDPVPQERSTECTYGYKHAIPTYRKDLRRKFNDLQDNIGLCLPCIRSNNMSSTCRIVH